MTTFLGGEAEAAAAVPPQTAQAATAAAIATPTTRAPAMGVRPRCPLIMFSMAGARACSPGAGPYLPQCLIHLFVSQQTLKAKINRQAPDRRDEGPEDVHG